MPLGRLKDVTKSSHPSPVTVAVEHFLFRKNDLVGLEFQVLEICKVLKSILVKMKP